MPLYEEKLISPLAVRYTQEHIRTTFRDGRVLEESLQEICAVASAEDAYDVFLKAPFPTIEILRYRSNNGTIHWFTLDNRRLYCLQRAAIAQWPRRVAAVVAILYADDGTIRKKYDTTTAGESVEVARSTKGPSLFRFNWRSELSLFSNCVSLDAQATLLAVELDAKKRTVAEFTQFESEVGTTALARLLAAAGMKGDISEDAGILAMPQCCETPSTIEGLSSASDSEAVEPDGFQQVMGIDQVAEGLAGLWRGSSGERYQVSFGRAKSKGQCVGSASRLKCLRHDPCGRSLRFTLELDPKLGRVWWGTSRKFFCEPGVASNTVIWYRASLLVAGSESATEGQFVWLRSPTEGKTTDSLPAELVENDLANGSQAELALVSAQGCAGAIHDRKRCGPIECSGVSLRTTWTSLSSSRFKASSPWSGV